MRTVKCKMDFGEIGSYVFGFDFEEQYMQQLREAQTSKVSIDDIIKEVILEYIISMRGLIEATNKNYNYDRLEMIHVDHMRIGKREFNEKINKKTDVLLKNMRK